MRDLRQFLLFIAASALVLPVARAQEETPQPSLGDVARQSRLQKQQKDAQQKDASKDVQSAKDAAPANPPEATGKDALSKETNSKDAPQTGKDAHLIKAAKKVITNEEIPEHAGPTRPLAPGSKAVADEPEQDSGNQKQPADYWRTRILSQKTEIASLKSDIDSLTASIQYAGGNCVSGCVEWNERQQQKQQQVDAMKVQLEQQQKQLEEMQEAARKQGYGSSVYEP